MIVDLKLSPEIYDKFRSSAPTRCRIEWAIHGFGTGNGEWYPMAMLETLDCAVIDQNEKYGAGTHWIIEE